MNRTSISDLKAKAKDQLLGNYGIAVGSFALLFALIMTINSIIMTPVTMSMMQDARVTGTIGYLEEFKLQALSMVISLIAMLFSVGYIRIISNIATGRDARISDLFFVFRHHPDKIIIIGFIMIGLQFVLLLPSTLIGYSYAPGQNMLSDGKKFLLYIVLYLAGLIVSFIIDLMLAMTYLIYLDDPDMDVMSIIRGSITMMKGNKFRYFYMLLSFIGYAFLVILSFGIAMLWVMPYQTMTLVEFYLDLKEGTSAEYAEVESL